MLIDDELKIRVSLSNLLDRAGYDVLLAASGHEGISLVEKNEVDLVLLDLVMPEMDGIAALKEILAIKPSLPVIILSGYGTIARAVEATKLGAFDFLEKPVESEKILISIGNALAKYRLEKEKAFLLRDALERYKMVGVSRAMQEIFSLIDSVAPTDSKVLITGESGSGKELIARAIHLRSHRAAGPFVVVNCAAVPEELIESELFGYEKGAFTGATEMKDGKFEQATGGTLFLDEVSDMSPRLQAKVLRALESEEIQRLGGKQTIKVDSRLICASNADLREAVKEKRFREDLYFRIGVIKIRVPPLRERKEDIPVLVDFYLRKFCDEKKIPPLKIHPAAMETLVNYYWPGNVRELKNLVEKAVVLSRSDIISKEDIAKFIEESSLEGQHSHASEAIRLREARAKAEKELVWSKLVANNWNYEKTAAELGISRATLFNKIKAYGLSRPRKN